MKSKLWVLAVLILCSCHKQPGNTEGDISSIEAPPSYLSFRIDFPMKELEDGVNRVLPTTVLDDALPIKTKDTLFLKVVRKGRVTMSSRKNEVFASIPLEVEAAIKKKMLGITISNLDAPIEFGGVLKASAVIGLKDDWNMDIACNFRGFELQKNPELSVMGFTFNIDGMIEKALEKHSDELSDVICNALQDAFDFRETVEKVWMDLQNPQRVAKKPTRMWLYSEPLALNGVLMPKMKDTLSVHVEYRTTISIVPDYHEIHQKVPLGPKSEPLNTKPALLAYPKLVLPFEELSTLLKREFIAQRFTYEGYAVQIKDVMVGRDGQKLKVEVVTEGDINGKVIATGIPDLNDDRELVLREFSYEIDAKDDWVKMTDWAVHEFAENYVEDKVRLDTKPFFDGLGGIIMNGLDKSRLGPKLDVHINFDKVSSYQIRLTNSAVEWVFFAEGTSGLTLKKGLFRKN